MFILKRRLLYIKEQKKVAKPGPGIYNGVVTHEGPLTSSQNGTFYHPCSSRVNTPYAVMGPVVTFYRGAGRFIVFMGGRVGVR